MKLLFFSLFVLFPQTVHAYLDPGTGSMLLQILMAGGAGIFLLVKILWRKTRQKFRNTKNK